ncbi:MAG: phosphotransferase [Methylocystaceae bacterium]|nr:phosphotransferase [Methylocystaceae bacterium]
MSDRQRLREKFLNKHGWGGVDCPLLAGDASFRKYYRLNRDNTSVVLMDAPPPEAVEPFVKIAEFLLQYGFSAPQILAQDTDNGFLLLEDLGDDTYTRLLQNGADERALYKLATDVLVELHKDVTKHLPDNLSDYDEEMLTKECLLLPDWWMKAALGENSVSEEIRDSYIEAWQPAFELVQKQPKVLVLRDFHVDNLLHLPQRDSFSACGLLDFQDAVLGSGIYDVMSLLEDARRDIKPALIEEMKMRYTRSFPDLDAEEFNTIFAILGAQRHAKVIGIFARLCMRDDKPMYLHHIPRVWRLFEHSIRHPALKDVRKWVDTHIAKDIRGIPACLIP